MKRIVFSAMVLLCAIASLAQTAHSVYTLTENCTITLSPSQDEYAVDDMVSVTITPAEGAIFDPNADFEIYVECTEEEYNAHIANARSFDRFKAQRKVGQRRAPASRFTYRLEIYTLDDGVYDYSELKKQDDGSYTCTFNMPARDVEIEATCTPSTTSYAITVTQADHGSTSVSPTSAVAGSTVTITATPNSGYEVDKVNVWERDGFLEDIIGYTSVDATHFTFTMPANPVRVEVTYQTAGTGVTLNDDEYNGQVIAEHDEQLVSKVTLAGRTLYKNGEWNTLCLPFDVTISGSPLDGDGVDVRTLDNASFESGTLTLNFTASGAVTKLEAGKPYLIKWDNTGVNLTETELVFSSVTIKSGMNDVTYDLGDDRSVTFKGTYEDISFSADDRTVLFLSTGNKLYYPMSGATIGAQRAYFKLSGITAGDLPGSARTFVLDFGDDETTSISEELRVKSEEFATATGWYTLEGLRLVSKPTTKGVYINNGKKIVVK